MVQLVSVIGSSLFLGNTASNKEHFKVFLLLNLDLIKFIMCTLVSRVYMTIYVLTKGCTVPEIKGTHEKRITRSLYSSKYPSSQLYSDETDLIRIISSPNVFSLILVGGERLQPAFIPISNLDAGN